MPSALYDKARAAFLAAGINWSTDTIKVLLLDMTQYGLQVSSATAATPIVVGFTAAHGLATGDRLLIADVGGCVNANGVWQTVTVVDATHVSLDGSSSGVAWSAGGFAVKMNHDQYLSDIPVGARVAGSPAVTTPTTTYGVADCDDVTFAAVSGATCQAVAIYKDTGVAGTSPLIAFLSDATGLPVTPNGGNIIVQWNNGSNKIFKL